MWSSSKSSGDDLKHEPLLVDNKSNNLEKLETQARLYLERGNIKSLDKLEPLPQDGLQQSNRSSTSSNKVEKPFDNKLNKAQKKAKNLLPPNANQSILGDQSQSATFKCQQTIPPTISEESRLANNNEVNINQSQSATFKCQQTIPPTISEESRLANNNAVNINQGQPTTFTSCLKTPTKLEQENKAPVVSSNAQGLLTQRYYAPKADNKVKQQQKVWSSKALKRVDRKNLQQKLPWNASTNPNGSTFDEIARAKEKADQQAGQKKVNKLKESVNKKSHINFCLVDKYPASLYKDEHETKLLGTDYAEGSKFQG